MPDKKLSSMEEQQALLKAKKDALSGKRLRQAGLLPAQRFGDPPAEAPSRLPLWPLLLLLPLLLIPLRPKTQAPLPPPPLNLSLPQVVFPAKVTLFYQQALGEEAQLCQSLFKSLGIAVKLEPLYGPIKEANCLYLLDGPVASKWQAEGFLAPMPLAIPGQLPVSALIYPSLWGSLVENTKAWALPFTVAPPFMFVKKGPWKKAGLGQAQIPKSWEEVLALLPRLQEYDPDGRPSQIAFWPLEESPLFWAYQLDSNLGPGARKTTAAWLGQLLYRQQLADLPGNRTRVMLVAKKYQDKLDEHYTALPPTPSGNPSHLVSTVSYLASPCGSKIAAKLPLAYAKFNWKFPQGLFPPVLGKVANVELAAVARATSLFLDPKKQQDLALSIYKELEKTGKERSRAGN